MLRVRADLLIGKRQTERIRFTLDHLPNKRWCSKKDSRDTCRAILVERLRKELDTRDVLLDELRKSACISPKTQLPDLTTMSIL